DLHELARLGDVAMLDLLRLDERVHAHRVSRAKKATARFKMSRSSRASRSSLRSWAISDNCSLVRPSERRPWSRSACLAHARTPVSGRFRSRATLPAVLPGRCTSSTTAALNSGVNDLFGRGCFFAIVSIVDILSGRHPTWWMSAKSGQAQSLKPA